MVSFWGCFIAVHRSPSCLDPIWYNIYIRFKRMRPRLIGIESRIARICLGNFNLSNWFTWVRNSIGWCVLLSTNQCVKSRTEYSPSTVAAAFGTDEWLPSVLPVYYSSCITHCRIPATNSNLFGPALTSVQFVLWAGLRANLFCHDPSDAKDW